MKKIKGGYNSLEIDNDINDTRYTRLDQESSLLGSENVLVNNLVHSLSFCKENAMPIATDGCINNESNKNAANYLYLQNIRGGNLNKMTNQDLYMEGGCYTCKKGKRKLFAFSRTLFIIVPKLESKYKKGDKKKFSDTVKKVTASKPNKKQVEKTNKPKKAQKLKRKSVKVAKSKKVIKKTKGGNIIDLVTNLDYLGLENNPEFVPANLNEVKRYTKLTSDMIY
jgi:hypothetical protein|tara:strand:- start:2875 stop:3546 length:672 start_codon:yes stop_codon:yes gene_type:complete